MKGLLAKIALGAALSLPFGIQAQADANATYPFIDVSADAGSYSPVALGENIQLNGCGSQVWAASGTPTFGWCDLTDYTEFSLEWGVWSYTNSHWSYTTIATYEDGAVAGGLTAVASTGVGTAFNAAGSYYIALYTQVTSSIYDLGKDVYVTLPGGLVRYPGGDEELASDGSTNYAYDYAFIQVTDAVDVPEPLGALLLFPGLFYIASRQRKRAAVRA